jgi:hypothetical protein
MTGHLIRVGVREFREDLAEYLDSLTRVAITPHGQTLGYDIPARGEVDQQDLLALKRAVEQLAALPAEHGISEEEIAREFRARGARTRAARPSSHILVRAVPERRCSLARTALLTRWRFVGANGLRVRWYTER